jgi:hypothetical protein
MGSMTLVAWSFRSELSLRDMLKTLNATWDPKWIEGDSSRHDYIAGRMNKEGVALLYKAGAGAYVVNLRFISKAGDAQAQLAEAKERLLTKALPLIGASDVQPSAPFE